MAADLGGSPVRAAGPSGGAVMPSGYFGAQPANQAAAVVENGQRQEQQTFQGGGMPRVEAMPLQFSHVRQGEPAEQF